MITFSLNFRHVVLAFLLIVVPSSMISALPDLEHLIKDLRSEDDRLVRLEVTLETEQKQLDEGICGTAVMDQVLSYLMSQNRMHKDFKDYTIDLIAKACEYVTLCVIDNAIHRDMFGQYVGIHQAIVGLMDNLLHKLSTFSFQTPAVDSSKSASTALAQLAHVVYVTSFTNEMNHQAYLQSGITTQLANMIKGTVSRRMDEGEEELIIPYPFVTMWSCAALGNIVASYCEKSDDHKCYYKWNDNGLTLEEDYIPVISDGTIARDAIVKDDTLMGLLVDLACIQHATHEDDIMVGSTAVINRDESLLSIIPWSSTYALFQLATNPSTRENYLEPSLTCFCQLTKSLDWLEEEKGLHLVERTRRSYPCYFRDVFTEVEIDEFGEEIEEPEFIGQSLCLNNEYHLDDGTTCDSFAEKEDPPTEEECAQVDGQGNPASESCCICGGGEMVHDPTTENLESEEEDEEREL